ncbi:MAG: hypothetical protein WBO36_10760, partial [Saprospiraceae bacterium]
DGQPFIVYNGILSKVFTPGNGAKGYIWGVQSQIKKEINKIWSINGAYSYTCGRNKKEGGDIPLDHIAPVLIKLGADATYKKINASFFILANGQKALQDYSPSGEDNLQYAPATGMPAWMTYHVKCQYRITNHIQFLGGVENILDTQYRYFASGINAPGRNFWFSGRVSF